ncbi:MAG: PLP-dependent transferase [Bacteroidetes bacterium]|nr:PLP-dependent transferase [Bacteroidota bacterium]
MSKSKKDLKFASITAQDIPAANEYVNPHAAPLYLSSTYVYESPEKAQEVFKGKAKAYIYSRWSHPNAELVERKIEQMESFGTKTTCKSLLFSSGMAAISALFQSLIKPGDSLIIQGNIYGTTVDYVNHAVEQFGLKVHYMDFARLDKIEAVLKKNKKVKLVYAETPSNPTINCYDLKALSSLSHKYKVKFAVDNTFASPYLQRPLESGADFVLHSSTKYLNGHGTGLSGVLTGGDVAFMEKNVWTIRKLHGSICSPFDAWMLNLGMKTLSLRMEQHCANAMAVAEWLQKHKAIAKVNYLGLSSHPDHALAKKQMKNFGGVVSFEMKKGYKAGEQLMKRLKFCKLTASLGTTDTLIQHPASMSHYFVPKAQREKFGITDGLVRLSVGIEDVGDIIGDMEQALR